MPAGLCASQRTLAPYHPRRQGTWQTRLRSSRLPCSSHRRRTGQGPPDAAAAQGPGREGRPVGTRRGGKPGHQKGLQPPWVTKCCLYESWERTEPGVCRVSGVSARQALKDASYVEAPMSGCTIAARPARPVFRLRSSRAQVAPAPGLTPHGYPQTKGDRGVLLAQTPQSEAEGREQRCRDRP